MTEKDSNGCLVWGLVGCAGLLVTSLCVLTGVGVLFATKGLPDLLPIDPDGLHTPKPEMPYVDPTAPLPHEVPLPGPPPAEEEAFDRFSLTVIAQVTLVTGSMPVAEGDRCRFTVDRVRRAQCHAQIYCGEKLLYGGPSLGYFECEIDQGPPPKLIGGDETTTVEEGGGDARMIVSTDNGSLLIADAGGDHGTYQMVARIESMEVSRP